MVGKHAAQISKQYSKCTWHNMHQADAKCNLLQPSIMTGRVRCNRWLIHSHATWRRLQVLLQPDFRHPPSAPNCGGAPVGEGMGCSGGPNTPTQGRLGCCGVPFSAAGACGAPPASCARTTIDLLAACMSEDLSASKPLGEPQPRDSLMTGPSRRPATSRRM